MHGYHHILFSGGKRGGQNLLLFNSRERPLTAAIPLISDGLFVFQPALQGCSRPARKLRAAHTAPPTADPPQRHLPSAPAEPAITERILTPQKWHALVSV